MHSVLCAIPQVDPSVTEAFPPREHMLCPQPSLLLQSLLQQAGGAATPSIISCAPALALKSLYWHFYVCLT